MLKEAVLHIPDSSYAFATDETNVTIRLRTKKGDLEKCSLCYGDRVSRTEPPATKTVPMNKIGSDELFDYYECVLRDCYPRIFYYFILEDEAGAAYYYADEFHKTARCDRTEYYQFAYVRREDVARVPSWAASAVIYQIFPDSFATEKRSVSGNSIQKPDRSGQLCVCRNGGTLKGISANLDYLVDLGINCIYLNPIFSASSYHKYDTADYFSVDPCFGTEDDLRQLVSECHRNGIRVILDGVFNHCGAGFFAFQDVLKNGAKSRYAGWFYRMEFPDRCGLPPDYETFAYVKEMPKLNTGNAEVAEYLCKVGAYWIRETDIDGWRLDVANEINHGFWRRFRETVKSVKPDAFLIGEIWENASPWLQGDQMDSTMNYGFLNLCRDFFAARSLSAEKFDQKLHAMVLRYKTPMAYAQMNLLDSHDVPRFLSRCGGDVRRLKLAFFFMMTFLGVPSIFYGDEAGIEGSSEQEYRKPMPWKTRPEKSDVFLLLRRMIGIRKQHKALARGDFRTVAAQEDGLYAYCRSGEGEKLLIVMNNSDTERTVKMPFPLLKPIGGISGHQETVLRTEGGDVFRLGAMEGSIFKILSSGG